MQQTMSPGFLIASPKLDGSPFERAVIAVVHHDEGGAMGFIVNKPVDVDLGTLLQSAEDNIQREVANGCFQMPVHFGGPVRVEQLWLIYHDKPGAIQTSVDETPLVFDLQFEDQWFVMAQAESIERLASGHDGLDFRPFVGYTGWGAGQLEEEIEEGSWLFLDFNDDYIFDTRGDDLWQVALDRLGVNPMAFLMMAPLAKA